MQIVDRYIFKQVIRGYIMLLLSFFLLYIVIDVFMQLDDILKEKTSIFTLVRYYAFFLPQIFVRVSPLSFLISSLYCIGILNRNNELISLRAQGFSVMAISRVFIVTSLLLSIVALFVEDRLVPESFTGLKKIEGYKNNADAKEEVTTNFAFYAQEGYVVFAKRFDVANGILSHVNLFVQDETGTITQEVIAERLVYDEGRWVMKNALEYQLTDGRLLTGNPDFLKEKELDLVATPRELFKESSLSWQDLSLKDIRVQIAKFSLWKAQKIIAFLEVEFHKKIALNFSTFFLMVGCLPFALRIKQRRVGLSSLGLAILMSFSYYLLFSLSSALGKVDFFLPWIGCWIPNIFFGISGIAGLILLN